MASPSAPFVVPSLANSFGALYIGVVVAAGLWGIGTAQTYWYYTSYPKDKRALKIFVASIWIVDTVHQILIAHVVYVYVVQNFFNPLILDHYLWSLDVQSLFEALTSVLAQSFFVARIWLISKHNVFLSAVPVLLVLAKFGTGIAYVATGFQTDSITVAFTRYHSMSEAINALAAAGDIVIAVSMCWLLYNARTGFGKSDNLLNKLMIYTVNTGLITSLCAIVTLVTAEVFPKAFIYGAFYFLTGRLYLNTVLGSLNARKYLSEKNAVITMSSVGRAGVPAAPETMVFANPHNGSHTSGTKSTAVNQGSQADLYAQSKPSSEDV